MGDSAPLMLFIWESDYFKVFVVGWSGDVISPIMKYHNRCLKIISLPNMPERSSSYRHECAEETGRHIFLTEAVVPSTALYNGAVAQYPVQGN